MKQHRKQEPDFISLRPNLSTPAARMAAPLHHVRCEECDACQEYLLDPPHAPLCDHASALVRVHRQRKGPSARGYDGLQRLSWISWSDNLGWHLTEQGKRVIARALAAVASRPRFVELEQQLELPREQRGVDYGAERPVLLQRGERCVVWQPGGTYWSGSQHGYCPSSLALTTFSGHPWGHHKELFEGRLTKKKLAVAAPHIAEWLGCTVEELPAIHRRKTFVWRDGA